jgi:DNA invertase Pin-like site-specific DNA recombinase
MSVWAYVRKSRALGDPDDDPAILAHQREALLRLAVQLGLPAPTVIEEVGSGERLQDRPRLAGLLQEWERVRPPAGTLLLVTAIDRLSRGTQQESGEIADRLAAVGVRVRTLSQQFDLSLADDRLVYGMLSVVGRYALDRYRQDVALRREQLTRGGEIVTGAAPYGYRWIPGTIRERGHLEVEPEEFAVVQWLFEHAPTMSLRRLAAATGLPSLTVSWILHNPVYTGYPHRHTRSKRSRAGAKGSKLLRPGEWTVRAEKPGNYPAAVTPAQFERVQRALLERWTLREKTGPYDGWCRRLLQREGVPSRVTLSIEGRNRVPCYVLTPLDTDNRHGRVSYPRAPIHEAARAAIVAALTDPETLRAALLKEEQRLAREQAGGDLRQMEADLERLRRVLTNLRLQAASDPEDRLADAAAQEQVRADIRALQQRMAQIIARDGRSRFSAVLMPLAGLSAADVEEEWESLPVAGKAELAEALLLRIVVRVVPKGRQGPNEREILAVEYQGWYRASPLAR